MEIIITAGVPDTTVEWGGGNLNLDVTGAFKGGAVSLEYSRDAGDTWVPFRDREGNVHRWTRAEGFAASLGACRIRAVTVDGEPDVKAFITEV